MAKINLEAPIILLGAGLSSGLMAAYLGRRGFKVEVYQRCPDPRTTDLYVGKSINLAISVRIVCDERRRIRRMRSRKCVFRCMVA